MYFFKYLRTKFGEGYGITGFKMSWCRSHGLKDSKRWFREKFTVEWDLSTLGPSLQMGEWKGLHFGFLKAWLMTVKSQINVKHWISNQSLLYTCQWKWVFKAEKEGGRCFSGSVLIWARLIPAVPTPFAFIKATLSNGTKENWFSKEGLDVGTST